jgi:cytochrome c biogenesis protein CcdA
MKKVGPFKKKISRYEERLAPKEYVKRYSWLIVAGIALIFVLFGIAIYWLGDYSHKTFSGFYAFSMSLISGVFGLFLGGLYVPSFQRFINKLFFSKDWRAIY